MIIGGIAIMRYKFISDSHTHSERSFDGNDSVMMMCEQAANIGLYSLTVTDHCECNEYFEKNVSEDISRSVMDINRAKAAYHNRVKIYTGIELGQPTQDTRAAQEALLLGNYDFVLGSLHNLKNEQDFYFLEYTKENVDYLLERYIEELYELASQNLFDSLAHLDYPLRYIIGNAGIIPDKKYFSDMLDDVLMLIIKNDKAIELNTSGLRQVIGRTLPDEAVLRRFRALGGKYVTLGSDAHRWGDIGSGIEDGLSLLGSCGFTHFTVFEKREPRLLPVS